MAKKVAILGGSFDPPHHGHIHLALFSQKLCNFDQVWVVPNYANPLKKGTASPEDRRAMTHLAFDAIPGCRVLDVEVDRKTLSYTVDTLEYLLQSNAEFQAAERYLLVASGVARSFAEWKDIDRVIEIARPVIAAGSPYRKISGLTKETEAIVRDGWTIFDGMNMSSTVVRQWLSCGRYVGHLVPHEVEKYIRTHNLYEVKI